MKSTILLLVLTLGLGLATAHSQSIRSIEEGEWLLSVGVNTINSQGSKSPVGDISDWAFRYPIAAGIETYWTRLFSIEVAASLNGYGAGDPIYDAGPSDNTITYFALDAHVKYYFGEWIFPRTEWIDFYALGGLGYFDVEDGNISANFGGGAVIWFDRTKSMGLKAQGVGKFAFDHSNTGSTFANNHFQYNLMMVFRL